MSVFGRLRHSVTRRRLNAPLGFVHMPKAGGTGMIDRLDGVLRPRQMIYRLDGSQFATMTDFSSFPVTARARIITRPGDIPSGADIIAGHLAPSSILAAAPDAKLVTFLRAPETRLLSHWFYWRSYDDDRLAVFGEWGRMIALSRRELAGFLAEPAIACQTDNLMLRMLLWPHPKIPAADFIDPADDAALLAAARVSLAQFAHTDIIENPALDARLDAFLNRTFGISPWNRLHSLLTHPEGRAPASNAAHEPLFPLKSPLVSQCAGHGGALLQRRSRLDEQLWKDVALMVMPSADPSAMLHAARAKVIARYDGLDGHADRALAA